MLIDMVMVQIGSGLVEKTQASRKIHIDAVDVGTLRITVFRDEIEGTWEHLTPRSDEVCCSPCTVAANVP